MRIEIDLGEHRDHTGTRLAQVVVDRQGALVDLRGLGGPANEPYVTRIEYDEATRDPTNGQVGHIKRKMPGSEITSTQALFSDELLRPYVEAWRAEMEKHKAS